jgi:KAP family P-loop domain
MPDSCKTVLLTDSPATTDSLGAHAKVAEALSGMLAEESGGRAVALEGTWGSGKSTVVNLVRQALDRPDVLVLVFDAWAHQGDPLRRTFLERFVRDLVDKGWLGEDSGIWGQRLEELARRRKETETQRTPILTRAGTILALSGLLLPTAAMLYDGGLPKLARVAGFVLALIPVTTVLIAALVARRHGRAFTVANLLLWKDVTSVKSTAIETPDPTSIEFAETFCDASRQALAGRARKLVIVVDNLDRVAPDDARLIWSTLQTFFGPADLSQDWRQQMWLLVPYDRDGMGRIWELDTGRGTETAVSFMEKTFQIRFEVPPPVYSRWSELLGRLMRKAFPEHRVEDFRQVEWVFDRYRRNQRTPGESSLRGDRPPTPRELTLFVNDMGAFHRQWGDEFPMHQVAYFVLLRRDGRDVISELRGAKIPDPDLQLVLGGEVRETLAALAFSAPVAEARQLLLEEPILESLETGDVAGFQARLGEWASWHSWLGGILSPRIEKLVIESPTALANLVSVLVESGAAATLEWLPNALNQHVPNIKAWNDIGPNLPKGIAAINAIANSESIAAHLLRAFEAVDLAGEKGGKAIADWVTAVVATLRELSQSRFGGAPWLKARVPGDSKTFVEACRYLGSDEATRSWWPAISAASSAKDVVAELTKHVATPPLTQDFARLCSVVEASGLKADLTPLVDALVQRLQPANALQGAEISVALDTLWRLKRSNVKAAAALENLGRSGAIDHHLQQAMSERNQPAVAACALTILSVRTNGEAPPAAGPNSASGHAQLAQLVKSPPPEFVAALDALASRTVGRAWYRKVFTESSYARPLAISLLRSALASGTFAEIFDSDFILGEWRQLRAGLGNDFPDFIGQLVAHYGLARAVCAGRFTDASADIYEEILKAGGAEDEEFVSWCRGGLRETGRDTWEGALRQPSSQLVALLVAIVQCRGRTDLGSDLGEAIVGVAEDVGSGKSPIDSEASKSWPRVFEALRDDTRRSTKGQLLAVATRRGGSLSEGFFAVFGRELRDNTTLREHKALMDDLFLPLMRERSHSGIRWLRDVLKDDPSLLEEFDPEDVRFFRERVESSIRGLGPDETKELDGPLRDIADVLGIKKSEALDSATDPGPGQ